MFDVITGVVSFLRVGTKDEGSRVTTDAFILNYIHIYMTICHHQDPDSHTRHILSMDVQCIDNRMTQFDSSSSDQPKLLNVSFDSDPSGSLGAQLFHADKGSDEEMFLPGFAVVTKLIEGDTVARKAGVQPGDIIVAVNGQGFRRFHAEYTPDSIEHLGDCTKVELDHRVVKAGSAYEDLLQAIKLVKGDTNGPPLVLTLERHDWDAPAHAYVRFLRARNGAVPAAMQMWQNHQAWKAKIFPIALKEDGLQAILQSKAVAEVHVDSSTTSLPPTVYVDYGKLLELQSTGQVSVDDVVSAFVIFTERMLRKSQDPRSPKTVQLIDLSDVSISSSFSTEIVRRIYDVFEPNYPETLHKMVFYPVSTITVRSIRW